MFKKIGSSHQYVEFFLFEFNEWFVNKLDEVC